MNQSNNSNSNTVTPVISRRRTAGGIHDHLARLSELSEEQLDALLQDSVMSQPGSNASTLEDALSEDTDLQKLEGVIIRPFFEPNDHK